MCSAFFSEAIRVLSDNLQAVCAVYKILSPVSKNGTGYVMRIASGYAAVLEQQEPAGRTEQSNLRLSNIVVTHPAQLSRVTGSCRQVVHNALAYL